MKEPVDYDPAKRTETEIRRPFRRIFRIQNALGFGQLKTLCQGAVHVAGRIEGHRVRTGEPALVVLRGQLPAVFHKTGGVAKDFSVPPGRVVRRLAAQGLFHVLIQGGKAFGKQILLRLEVVVKCPGGNSRLFADIAHRDRVKALFPHQRQGGGQNRRFRLPRLLFPPLRVVHAEFPQV